MFTLRYANLCVNGIGNLCKSVVRGYAIEKPIPVKWERPEKIWFASKKRSGDGGINFKTKETDFLTGYEQCEALQKAPDLVKKLFTLEFHREKETFNRRNVELVQLVKRHKYDDFSTECKIAYQTNLVLWWQSKFLRKSDRYNGGLKRRLCELMSKRKKLLKLVRLKDYKRFEYLLEKLNLYYKPQPEEWYVVTRRSGTKKLLQKWIDDRKQEKLDTYKALLESQHKDFFIDKAKKLEFVRNEQLALGVPTTVTEEEIEQAKKKAAQYL